MAFLKPPAYGWFKAAFRKYMYVGGALRIGQDYIMH